MTVIISVSLLYRFNIETSDAGHTTNLLLSLPYNIEWNITCYSDGIEVLVSQEDLTENSITLKDLIRDLEKL